MDEVAHWQQRPLETMYPIVYFDALRLKIRDEGTVKNDFYPSLPRIVAARSDG